jgi:Alkylmercury lyase
MADLRHGTGPLEVLGRAGQGRLAPTAGGLRAVQQAVLRSFAATGSPPSPALLAEAAAPFGVTATEVIGELAREDFLALDEAGRIRAAYPFSAVPTRHQVRIGGAVEVYAMCAVDALGIAPMLTADTVITSADPVIGAPVTVTFTGGRTVWEPPGAVVLTAHRRCSGPAAQVSCGSVNFFASNATARAWKRAHRGLAGRVLGQAEAEQTGGDIFGALLAADP